MCRLVHMYCTCTVHVVQLVLQLLNDVHVHMCTPIHEELLVFWSLSPSSSPPSPSLRSQHTHSTVPLAAPAATLLVLLVLRVQTAEHPPVMLVCLQMALLCPTMSLKQRRRCRLDYYALNIRTEIHVCTHNHTRRCTSTCSVTCGPWLVLLSYMYCSYQTAYRCRCSTCTCTCM